MQQKSPLAQKWDNVPRDPKMPGDKLNVYKERGRDGDERDEYMVMCDPENPQAWIKVPNGRLLEVGFEV